MKNKFNTLIYIFKEIKTKRNIFLIIICAFLFIGLFLSMTLIKNNNDKIEFYTKNYIPNIRFEAVLNDRHKKEMEELDKELEENNYTGDAYYEWYKRRMSIYFDPTFTEEEKNIYEKIKQLDHVVSVRPAKYNRDLRFEVDDGLPQTDSNHKEFFAKPLEYESDIKLISGTYPKENEVVCPAKMYFTGNLEYYSEVLDKSREYTTKIGDTFNVFADKFKLNKDDIVNIKVVGIYDNFYTHDHANVCYTALETVDNFNTADGGDVSVINGKKVESTHEIYGVAIRVDSVENVQEVKRQIEDMNMYIFNYNQVSFVGSNLMQPYQIGIVSIILLLTVFILYVRKKCLYKRYNYGLLKVQGYTDNKILIIEFVENTITMIISYLLSLMIYVVLFNLAPHRLTYYYEVYGNLLTIPYSYILLVIPVLILIVLLVTYISVSYYLRKKIVSNLEVS